MKKKLLRFCFFLLFLFVVVTGFCLINSTLISERISTFYLDSAQPCIQKTVPETNQLQATPHPNCVQGSFEATLLNEPGLNEFISSLVVRDFPGYQLSSSWLIFGQGYPWINTKNLQWVPLIKAVWICNFPVAQYITTSTRLLALCSATPNSDRTGYDGAVKIYEFGESAFGVVGRLLYEEPVSMKEERGVSTLFSVEFRMYDGLVSSELTKHHFRHGRDEKASTKVLVQKDKKLVPLFEFERFVADIGSPLCSATKNPECPVFERFFDLGSLDLINGGIVYAYEAWYSEESDGQPDEGIPYIFDAKKWTLKRQFPEKTDEHF